VHVRLAGNRPGLASVQQLAPALRKIDSVKALHVQAGEGKHPSACHGRSGPASAASFAHMCRLLEQLLDPAAEEALARRSPQGFGRALAVRRRGAPCARPRFTRAPASVPHTGRPGGAVASVCALPSRIRARPERRPTGVRQCCSGGCGVRGEGHGQPEELPEAARAGAVHNTAAGWRALEPSALSCGGVFGGLCRCAAAGKLVPWVGARV